MMIISIKQFFLKWEYSFEAKTQINYYFQLEDYETI